MKAAFLCQTSILQAKKEVLTSYALLFLVALVMVLIKIVIVRKTNYEFPTEQTGEI